MKIHFIRHLKTEWNLQGRIQGSLNSKLLNDNNFIAKKIAKYLIKNKVQRIYFSPLKRCSDTLEMISENIYFNFKKSDKRIRELNHGNYEGKLLSELSLLDKANKNKDPWGWRWPCGESYQDLANRVNPFLIDIKEFEQKEDIAILSHEGVIRVCIKELCSINLDKFLDLKVPNNVIYSVENNMINLHIFDELNNLILTKL